MKATIQKVTSIKSQWRLIVRDETGGIILTIANLATAPKPGDVITVKYRNGKFIINA